MPASSGLFYTLDIRLIDRARQATPLEAHREPGRWVQVPILAICVGLWGWDVAWGVSLQGVQLLPVILYLIDHPNCEHHHKPQAN